MFYFLSMVLFFVTVLSWLFLITDSKKIDIRGPCPLPLFGNSLIFLGNSANFLKVLSTLSQKYKDAVRIHIFHKRFVFLSHPKFIEPILSSTKTITKGYKVSEAWLGEGLIRSTGNRWKTHRKFLTPAFHYNMLPTFLPIFLKNQKVLIQNLNKLANGESFDLFPVIAAAALDNIAESIMGVSLDTQRQGEIKYVNAIKKITEILSLRMRLLISETLFNLSPYKKKHDEILKYLHGYTLAVIEARREELMKANVTHLDYDPERGTKNKNIFLDLLLLTKLDGKIINDVAIREEVDNFMFAGHDTTTSGIVFCLYCLAKCTTIQNKVFEEQKHIFCDNIKRDAHYSDFINMKYLDLVIKESLRLYPPVPLIERLITTDTNEGGLSIPSKTTVVVNIFQMQRHPELYDDPLEFRPERFEKNTKPFNWIPFSAGPRNCIGQKFAMLEMKNIISSIVRNFIVLPSDVEPELCTDIILRSQNGVHVKLASRS